MKSKIQKERSCNSNKFELENCHIKKNIKTILISIIVIGIMILLILGPPVINENNSKLNVSVKKMESSSSAEPQVKENNAENDINPISEDTSWNANSARTFLLYKTSGTFGGVDQKNYIHVFAFEGDTICLGTNVYNSSINLEGNGVLSKENKDEESIDIVMHDLEDNLIGIDIKGESGSPGYIEDYQTEQLAKTMTSPKGKTSNGKTYVPYTYTVKETGVYTFEFRSYNGNGGSNVNNDKDKTKGWSEPSSQGSYIAAWDITVFNENNEKETGRTYADFLSLQMTGTMKEKYYVVTDDSYIYEMKFSGIAPYTFSFFSNNIGITDIANGNILYKSVKDLRNDIKFSKFGVNYTYPTTDDTDSNKNFYIFFDKPNDDLKGYIYGQALLPDPATNVKFSSDGEIYQGSGGYFSFDVEEATTATLRLEFNLEDGKKYAPVEISDVVKPYSTNYFYWDGKDGNGEEILAGTYDSSKIKYSVTTKAGEVHFPLIDLEDVTEGITFTRISNIYDKSGKQVDTENSIYDKTKNVIYYDDTAIYYGEKITATGASEDGITYSVTEKDSNNKSVTVDKPVPKIKDNEENEIYAFRNICSKDNTEYKLYTTYGKNHRIKSW